LYDKAPFPLIVKPAARYLALIGNIGIPRTQIHDSFLDYCSRHWEHVFYIPGTVELPHIWSLEYAVHNKPRISLLHNNNMSHYISKHNVAILGTSDISTAETKQKFSDLLEYWTYQKTPVCAITYANPTKKYTKLMKRPIQAWLYGDEESRTSGMYGTMYAAVNGSLQNTPHRQSAFVEFPAERNDTDAPLQELAATAVGLK